jgi:hypothetical protein
MTDVTHWSMSTISAKELTTGPRTYKEIVMERQVES